MSQHCGDFVPLEDDRADVLLGTDGSPLGETAYLLQNPANAGRLLTSIQRLEASKDVEEQSLETSEAAAHLHG